MSQVGALPVAAQALEGQRVFVRRMTSEDAPELAMLLHESLPFHRPWVSYPHTESGINDYILAAAAEGTKLFVAGRTDTGDLVGVMSLSRFAMGAWRTCECGCAVVVRHRGHGYLADAMDLLVRHAMADLGMCRVEALVDPENASSSRMLRAVGFRPEGIARSAIGKGRERFDQVRWAVTASDVLGEVDIERR